MGDREDFRTLAVDTSISSWSRAFSFPTSSFLSISFLTLSCVFTQSSNSCLSYIVIVHKSVPPHFGTRERRRAPV